MLWLHTFNDITLCILLLYSSYGDLGHSFIDLEISIDIPFNLTVFTLKFNRLGIVILKALVQIP